MSINSGMGHAGIVAIPIPPDGATGDVLTKLSAADYDMDWQPGGGFTGLGIWRYRTEITEPPASGQIRFNNADPELATLLWVHETNSGGTDMEAFLGDLTAGSLIYIQDRSNASNFIVVEISSNTDDGTYREFGIADVEQQGASIGQNQEVILVVSGGGAAAGAPIDATYVTITANATLTDERVLTAGTGLNIVDGGAGGPVTLNVDLTLQEAYNNDTSIPHIVAAAALPVTFRPNSDPEDAFAVQRNSGDQILLLASLAAGHEMTLGPVGNRSWFWTEPATTSNPTTAQIVPDGRTKTVINAADNSSVLLWDSTFISNIPAGGGIGNDGGFGMVFSIGNLELLDQGNLFSTAILFNQATRIDVTAANSGPVYTMVNQPVVRNLGGTARTMSQANAVRSQMRLSPEAGGNLTLTSHETYFATIILDSSIGVGDAFATTVNYFAPKAPSFLGVGGAITTLNVMDIPAIPIAGITNLRGINSAMSAGTFINHTGTAPAEFGGDVTVNSDTASLSVGATSPVSWTRSAANTMRIGGTETLDWDFAAAVNNIRVTSASGASINFDTIEMAFGPGVTADGTNNWVFAFAPGLRSTNLGGDYSEVLFTSSTAITIAHAIGTFATWTINFPTVVLGAGSITNATNVLIQTNPNQGTTDRTGLRITSNPSGGAGVNAALYVTAGLSRFDGRVDINNPIALGGGAAATLGTIGGAGPTVAAQNQWLEVDIGGTAHWIPVWI